jgi:hypothetical protein
MEKGISYLNRTFNDYKESLLNYTRQYYPEIEADFNDASVGSWLVDVVSNIGDNLSYHIDRVYQETNIDSANEKSSIYAMARTKGVKIPGPKASMAEVKFSCELPVANNGSQSEMSNPDWNYAPIIKRGTKLSSGTQDFELLHDVNFREQFNEDGISDRTIIPKRNSNGFIVKYIITKTGIISAGETKIYSKVIKSSDITPFMSFIIPDKDVMNVESIIFKDGSKHYNSPTLSEFFIQTEVNSNKYCEGGSYVKTWRFFEVDYLAQQYLWGDYPHKIEPVISTAVGADGKLIENQSVYSIKKGAWIPITQKFITEFSDKGYLKVTFGAGMRNVNDNGDVNTNKITTIMNSNGLGVLPQAGTTMYVLYRKGGGATSNVAQGAITNITNLKLMLDGPDSGKRTNVKRSISVINTTPSVSGRDMLTVDELKNYIKYNNGAQERCVTIKDYHDRIAKLPAKYGSPFRYGVTEENNKIIIYTLGLDHAGKLSSILPDVLMENIQNYLSEYKMINDYIEIKSGRIINLQFEIDLYVDKNYNTSDVLTNVINTVKNYMDIHKLQMGDDIFVGDIEKEISKIDGVLNLIDLRVFNKHGGEYSSTITTQQTGSYSDYCNNGEDCDNNDGEENRKYINLKASDKMLYTENDTMFEIRFPETDIICKVKLR